MHNRTTSTIHTQFTIFNYKFRFHIGKYTDTHTHTHTHIYPHTQTPYNTDKEQSSDDHYT